MKVVWLKTNYILSVLGLTLMGIVVFYGAGRYQLNATYEQLLNQNDQLLTYYEDLKKQLPEATDLGSSGQLHHLARNVDQIGDLVDNILQSPFVPAEFKLYLTDKVEFASLATHLTQAAERDIDHNEMDVLQRRVNGLGEQLSRFDRLVEDHLYKKGLWLNNIVIICLALLAFVSVNIVFLWNRQVALPFKSLSGRIKGVLNSSDSNEGDSFLPTDVDLITRTLNNCIKKQKESLRELAVFHKAADTVGSPLLFSDENGEIQYANKSAEGLMAAQDNPLAGQDISVIFAPFIGEEQEGFLQQLSDWQVEQQIEITIKGQHYKVAANPLSANKNRGKLVVFEKIHHAKFESSKVEKVSQLAAVGELASDTAHQICDLSNSMMNYGQLIIEELAESGQDGDTLMLAKKLMDSGERIACVANQQLFLNCDKPQADKLVSVEKVVKDSLALMAHQLRMDGIQVRTTYPPNLPLIKVNSMKVRLAFLNVLQNARYALNQKFGPGKAEDKEIDIRCEWIQHKESHIVRTTLTDKGGGIAANIRSTVFEPFFSTKPQGEGTGLGLSVSKQIINQHKGDVSVSVTSIAGESTSIIVDLPAHAMME